MVSDPVDITCNPVFWKQKQEDFEFEVRLDCIDRLSPMGHSMKMMLYRTV